MKPKTAVITIAIFGILIIIAAYLQRGEFGVGPEWVLPVLMAFVLPIDENRNARDDDRSRPQVAGSSDQD